MSNEFGYTEGDVCGRDGCKGRHGYCETVAKCIAEIEEFHSG